jgi:hypothetical protein
VRNCQMREVFLQVAKCVLLITAGALMSSAHAQSCQPIQGSWRLSLRASQMGPSLSFNPYYTIRAVQLRLSESNGSISETWSFKGRHLDETWRYAFVPDGTTQKTYTKSVLYSVPTAVTATWQNCTLIVIGHSSLFHRPISTKNTYVFSPDGRTLTIIQSVRSPIAHQSRRLVFKRLRTRGRTKGARQE